ncbi:MAG: MarR family transcriptional regulator [Hyphomicrobiaceae bacterium]
MAAAQSKFARPQTATLGRIIDKLHTRGLIERHPDPSDRRVWLLYLTSAARPKLSQLRRLGEVTRGEALAVVPEADTERLLNTLQTLKPNLTDALVRFCVKLGPGAPSSMRQMRRHSRLTGF